ncbi:hypothetical protein [Sphingomonas sp.]|uniref:hypothetical protein n=1 Tax=Sphingomonas sp. TaxID=28214 RepID=UPI0025CD1411|nr:hypothetical protein [Sphingomonas sp.]
MTKNLASVGIITALALLGACAKTGEIDSSGGITAARSACPAVAIPASTGDVTLFNPVNSRDARAIDVVASITNLRDTCADVGSDVSAAATFEVQARRTSSVGARDVVLPYFVTIVRGGDTVVAKRLSRVALHFNEGQLRTTASATGGALIDRASATLPQDVQDKLQRKRKAADADASIDPLSQPDVRAAVARVSFEALIGFQLTPEQLQYNVTR